MALRDGGVTHIVDALASNMTLQSISVPGSSVEHVNALIASLPHTTMDLAFVLSQEQGISYGRHCEGVAQGY